MGENARRERALMAAGVGAAAGLGMLGAGALGIGHHYATVLLDPARVVAFPERVLRADADSVTLATSRLVRQPGVWGLRWPEGLAVIGPILSDDRHGVRRALLGGPVPREGAAVIDAGPFDPDPAARGLPFTEVAIPTPLGPAPAWHVPGGSDTWVIAVHGRGGRRREALRILPALHRLGLPTLVISYRNDDDAPPSPDGHFHLGDSEWEDLEAAVRWACVQGARRIVVVAWSMGAAITGAFLDRSAAADLVVAQVWDAPLVDWRATLRRQARNRLLPPQLVGIATVSARRRIGIDFDRFDLLHTPPRRRPPTLIVHSTPDTAVPVGPSRALAAAGPGLGWPIELVEVAGVEHTAAWNADPDRYEQLVTDFLDDRL
ncbi:alpha/beta hydrolase [Pseudonocardia oroxyli]|nr:prolyl oligopeptidase family serine peptidase [Pseudonocardia oroxyli]